MCGATEYYAANVLVRSNKITKCKPNKKIDHRKKKIKVNDSYKIGRIPLNFIMHEKKNRLKVQD